MMTFGWRPEQSCYTQGSGGSPSGDGSNCPKPTWWWVLLALAVVGAKK